MRIERVRRSEPPHPGHRRDQRASALFRRPRRFRRRLARHPFLQQQLGRLDARIAVEARHHDVVEQRVGQGHEGHALVVRHVGAHDHALRPVRGRVVGSSDS